MSEISEKGVSVPMANGLSFLVSPEDYERVTAYGWCAPDIGGGRRYVRRNSGKKRETWFLHRWLLNAPAEMEVDHINGDKLDNRRENLRLCKRHQNAANRPSKRGFRGVFSRADGSFFTRISVNGKKLYGGSFGTRIEAASRYNELARHFHGEFAVVNAPDALVSLAAQDGGSQP